MARPEMHTKDKGVRKNIYADQPLIDYINKTATANKAGNFSREVVELLEVGIKMRDGAQAMADINAVRNWRTSNQGE